MWSSCSSLHQEVIDLISLSLRFDLRSHSILDPYLQPHSITINHTRPHHNAQPFDNHTQSHFITWPRNQPRSNIEHATCNIYHASCLDAQKEAIQETTLIRRFTVQTSNLLSFFFFHCFFSSSPPPLSLSLPGHLCDMPTPKSVKDKSLTPRDQTTSNSRYLIIEQPMFHPKMKTSSESYMRNKRLSHYFPPLFSRHTEGKKM